MKLFPIFVLLAEVLIDFSEGRIKKRLTNETAENSFHINVSAGYGVQSENNTREKFAPSRSYQFLERPAANNDSTREDQISQPSNNQAQSTFSYQVQEPTSEVLDKSFGGYKYHYQPSKGRPGLKELEKVVNSLEDDTVDQQKSAKIVEVVRVPAIYELHFQSNNQDAQRFVTLHPWTSKLTGFAEFPQKQVQQQQYFQSSLKPTQFYQSQQKPVVQQQFFQSYQQRPVQHYQSYKKPLHYASVQFGGNKGGYSNYVDQPPSGYVLNQKVRVPYLHSTNGFEGLRQNSYGSGLKTILQPKPTYKAIQHYYQIPESVRKPNQEFLHWEQQGNQEISGELYKKPQAIHEVPAPALNNKQPYGFPKLKTTAIPMIYGHQSLDAAIEYQFPESKPTAVITSNFWQQDDQLPETKPLTVVPTSLWQQSHQSSETKSLPSNLWQQSNHQVAEAKPLTIVPTSLWQQDPQSNDQKPLAVIPSSLWQQVHQFRDHKPLMTVPSPGAWRQHHQQSHETKPLEVIQSNLWQQQRGPLDNIRLKPITASYDGGSFRGHVDSVPNDFSNLYQIEKLNGNEATRSNNNVEENLNHNSVMDGVEELNSIGQGFYVNGGTLASYLDQNDKNNEEVAVYVDGNQPNYEEFPSPQIFPNQLRYDQRMRPEVGKLEQTVRYESVGSDSEESVKEEPQLFQQDMLMVNAPQPMQNHEELEQSQNYNQFESMKIHQGGSQKIRGSSFPKKNYPRPFRAATNRRQAPTDYIILIKERTIE